MCFPSALTFSGFPAAKGNARTEKLPQVVGKGMFPRWQSCEEGDHTMHEKSEKLPPCRACCWPRGPGIMAGYYKRRGARPPRPSAAGDGPGFDTGDLGWARGPSAGPRLSLRLHARLLHAAQCCSVLALMEICVLLQL